MFINVIPVKIGRTGGAAALSGTLNAITYAGAAAATWGIGKAAESFGWNAVFIFWLVMALVPFAITLCYTQRWKKFVPQEETR